MTFREAISKYFEHRRRQVRALSMVLRVEELPGTGWMTAEERTWRVGESPGLPYESQEEYDLRREGEAEHTTRAREAGDVAAFRMAFKRNPLREVIIQVFTYESVSDARAGQLVLMRPGRDRPRLKVTFVDERLVSGELPEDSHAVFHERNQVHHGESCNVRTIVGVEDRYVYSIGCSSHGGAWTWEAVTAIAALQSEKIQTRLRLAPEQNGKFQTE